MGKGKQVEETTLASEVIAEVKRNSKRWFIIALAGWIAAFFLAGAFIYLSYYAPVEDTTSTHTESYDIDSKDNGNAIYNDSGKVSVDGENKDSKNNND